MRLHSLWQVAAGRVQSLGEQVKSSTISFADRTTQQVAIFLLAPPTPRQVNAALQDNIRAWRGMDPLPPVFRSTIESIHRNWGCGLTLKEVRPLSPERWGLPGYLVKLADKEGRVVATDAIYFKGTTPSYEVSGRIWVDPSQRRRGIGGEILRRRVDLALALADVTSLVITLETPDSQQAFGHLGGMIQKNWVIGNELELRMDLRSDAGRSKAGEFISRGS